MLISLKIENIALVEKISLDFSDRLTVITGETGAGKSVLVSALALIAGGRADRELIRSGESKARVVATFSVNDCSPTYRREFADYINDNKIKINREIFSTGTSKIKINGEVTTLSRLREITNSLVEIVGQNANQMLMNEDNHLYFLDHFAVLEDLRDEVSEIFSAWQKIEQQLIRVKRERDQRTKERELLLFQQKEIELANISLGEEDELVHEKKILDSSRTLMEHAQTVGELLDHEDGSTLDYLRQTRIQFEKMSAIDEKLEKQVKEFAEVENQLEELRQFVERYGSSITDNPSRLEEINDRLKELYDLKSKYGGTEESILETLNTVKQGIEERPDVDRQIHNLENEALTLRNEYTEKALSLTTVRRKAASYLQKLVVKELNDLAIDKASFEFDFLYEEDTDGIQVDELRVRPFADGLEKGRFLFSANVGEPLKSLVKTASGGETSRVLLAIKAAEKKNNNLARSLLVFDEVDSGIGGETANAVADKLKLIATSCQMLVITHLHQIARKADQHFRTQKTAKKDARSTIEVQQLQPEQIQTELDRMVALPKPIV